VTGRVLVTGAAGFIGGYVVAELLRRGYLVVGLDDLSKYGELRTASASRPGYRFVPGDARDTGLVTELLAGCEHFVAAAAMVGGIGYFHAYPYDLLAANERLTAAACDAAIAARRDGALRKITFLSSSMVYENADCFPSREGQQLQVPPPATAYGFQKLAVEYFATAAWQQYGLPFTIVRPFNCVGVGETRSVRDGRAGPGEVRLASSHVVPDLVRRALSGQDPLHVLGSGEQVRHYTYGGDLARGIVTAMEHPAAAGEDFNLSTDRGTTVTELATLIWHKINGPDSPPRLVHDKPYPGDVQRRVPDTAKAARLLGFTATTTLDRMLDEVIAWLREAIRAGLM
jgi:UDP-glucose 4-epimerase